MDRTYIKKVIKKHLAGGTVGVNKAGNIVVRQGYFYTHGKTHDDLAKTVNTVLDYYRSTATIVDKGTVWKPFRGGATTANSSHWFVEVKVA